MTEWDVVFLSGVRKRFRGRAGKGVRPQGGAAAVEFALLLPVLMAMLMGTLEIGMMLYNKAVLTNATREGARAGIVLRNPKPSVAEITSVAPSERSRTRRQSRGRLSFQVRMYRQWGSPRW